MKINKIMNRMIEYSFVIPYLRIFVFAFIAFYITNMLLGIQIGYVEMILLAITTVIMNAVSTFIVTRLGILNGPGEIIQLGLTIFGVWTIANSNLNLFNVLSLSVIGVILTFLLSTLSLQVLGI